MAEKKVKIKCKPEGRPDMWIPEKESLIEFIKDRKLEYIHHFNKPRGNFILGCDYREVDVIADINRASRLAIFTTPTANMGHSLALVFGDYDKGEQEKLECYDIGSLEIDNLEII